MSYQLMFSRSHRGQIFALTSCLRSDSSAIENYVPALKNSSVGVTENIKEYSQAKEICLIWSNFEFAFGEKLACLDIFYHVINVH